MARSKGIHVTWCPIGQEYCYLSCYFRMGDRCYFRSTRGRRIKKLKKGKSTPR
ncbi:MAG: hypothetical protein ABIK32_07915 [Chloroflexota bacterium]